MKYLIQLKSLGLFVFILLFSGCADKYSKTDMIGQWNVKTWTVESTGKTINSKMDMNFESDGKYDIDYGAKKEKGEYWISGEYLHTKAEGKSEMSVRILDLNADSLVIQMNRGGEMEKVVLTQQ